MSGELDALDTRLAGLLSAIGPDGRRALARRIAESLRTSQAQRIAAQQNPDGTPYAPRKPQTRLRGKKGGLRRTMFAKLRTAAWLKRSASADAAVVAFAPGAQRIAQVHHFGLRDRVNRSGMMVGYPARRLLGLTDAEIGAVEDLLLDHLAQGKL